jgi:hypothetical protein
MAPEDFIAKWRGVELSERAASQDHFNELCELLEIRKPTDDDPTGESFAFEKPVPNAGKGGGGGFADVWRKGCFVWEYKRKGRFNTLAAALGQARDYADLLEHPPLAIACDIDEIQIRTLFTGSVSVLHTIRLGELNDVAKRQLLRRCFTDPASLKPEITRQAVTEEAARKFATLAQNLRERRDRIGQQESPSFEYLFGDLRRHYPIARWSPSRDKMILPLAFSIVASMNCGRCASALGWALETIPVTRRPLHLRPSRFLKD